LGRGVAGALVDQSSRRVQTTCGTGELFLGLVLAKTIFTRLDLLLVLDAFGIFVDHVDLSFRVHVNDDAPKLLALDHVPSCCVTILFDLACETLLVSFRCAKLQVHLCLELSGSLDGNALARVFQSANLAEDGS
jgi:hypothetical protein